MSDPKPPTHWGRRLPNFVATDEDGRRFEYHRDVTRGPTVFLRGEVGDAAYGATAALARRATVLALGAAVPVDGARSLLDPDARIRAALFPASNGMAEAILADPDQRLVARVELDEAGLGRLNAALDGLERSAGQERRATAPVMLLPNVVDPDLRARLIARFEADNREGTVAILDADGEVAHVELPDRKRRRDLTLGRDDPLYGEVRDAIAGRLMPELWKAWWVERLRPEAFYIACYGCERADFFAAHRDNNLPGTARRRIAVSIELNDDYAGGGLMFPEYSDDRWRAPAGGALAFSCSLLHEAVPVTSGDRYVLLAFLAAPS